MGSASTTNHHHHPMPTKPPAKRGAAESLFALPQPPPPENPRNPHPEALLNPNPLVEANGQEPPPLPYSSAPMLIDGSAEDEVLRRAEFLTREEVLHRRSRRLKQLSRFYRDQYWGMMEEVRTRYREYYWKYGKSPVEEVGGGVVVEEMGETGRGVGVGVGLGEGVVNGGSKRKRESVVVEFHGCTFPGCKAKAMALTSYCHQHILSDPRQTLYKACTYVIKSAQTGQIVCGKPVLRSAMPSLCPVHFQKAQRHVSQALKKAGLTMTSSSKLAPKFHVIVAEYVRQIQAKRREAWKTAKLNMVDKDKHVD